MPDASLNPDYDSDVRRSFERQRLMQSIGAELVRVAPGEIDIALSWNDDLAQQTGLLHAGVIASIADSACGYAALTLMPPQSEVVSVEFKLNLLAPALAPRFLARGRVIRAGRTITTTAADVYALAQEETLVATMLGTMMRREILKGPGLRPEA